MKFLTRTGLRPTAALLPVLMALVMGASLLGFALELRGVAVLAGGYHNYLAGMAFRSDATAAFLPILATIPAAAGFVEDVQSKFARFYLLRNGYRRYLIHRLLTAAVTGGLTGLLGGLLLWGGCALALLPRESGAAGAWGSLLPVFVLLFLCGGLWSVAGLAMSSVMESKYIAYCSPFVLYYLLVILCERYFPDAFLLYPPNWVKPELWPYGVWGVGIFLTEVTVLFGILFVFRAGRRLREL